MFLDEKKKTKKKNRVPNAKDWGHVHIRKKYHQLSCTCITCNIFWCPHLKFNASGLDIFFQVLLFLSLLFFSFNERLKCKLKKIHTFRLRFSMFSEITVHKIISMSLVISMCGQRKDEDSFQWRGWSQGGGYLKWTQRARFDWVNLGLHRGAAPATGGRGVFFFFFFPFPVAFFLIREEEEKKMGTGARLERDHRPAPDQRAPH